MSGGQQQRVALARALVIQPRILLLDEPLSNLDAKLREDMQIELRQIQRSLGTTTILVTHDQSRRWRCRDRIVVMNQGRVEQIASPQDAYERPATPFVAGFLGRTNILKARADGDGIRHRRRALAGDHRTGPATATVRPEKIVFASTDQTNASRVSSRRAYSRATTGSTRSIRRAGLVIVIRQNTGEVVPTEGEAVRLAWRARGHDVAGGGRSDRMTQPDIVPVPMATDR